MYNHFSNKGFKKTNIYAKTLKFYKNRKINTSGDKCIICLDDSTLISLHEKYDHYVCKECYFNTLEFKECPVCTIPL